MMTLPPKEKVGEEGMLKHPEIDEDMWKMALLKAVVVEIVASAIRDQ